ncbi:PaaI family thioesterase [uncultured Bradyrhizobium sp.]|uniref:PaaI family thioesterase n=1 Tax=Bradyrhizobium sp. TaxID=376 RepID=UPI0026125B9C|nr:PaaI family thioesterase [uncultured Bradyrhizobium sp.]
MTPETITLQFRKIPFFRFLDLKVTEFDDTHAIATMPFADRLIGNPIMEHYHGGIIASLMEAVAAITAKSGRDGQPPKPINLTIDYLRPAVKGPLIVRATVTRKGKRMASVRTVSWQDDDSRPVAEGLHHFLVV